MLMKEVIIFLMFGCLGFFLAFFTLRTVNVALILLLTWIPFKVMEKFGLVPDWELFDRLKEIGLNLASTLTEIILSMVNIAPTASMIFFLMGGIAGIMLNFRWKKA